MKHSLLYILCLMVILGCEKADFSGETQDGGNVSLQFLPAGNTTRATIVIGDYFHKLNVQLFTADGEKVFDKVRTQTIDEEDFGHLSLSLAEGVYTVVAVGHSSVKSATIKSPQMVQFTASNGEKLTDTFCYCGQITVGETPEQHSLEMQRATAMFRVQLTDETIPANVVSMKFDYTGGSANFNPTTFEGTTKSTQSENRAVGGKTYRCYTFPYMAASGKLKMTLSALAEDGTIIRKRTWTDVPVERNRITTYTGQFFSGDEGAISQSGFGFIVNGEWGEEITVEF